MMNLRPVVLLLFLLFPLMAEEPSPLRVGAVRWDAWTGGPVTTTVDAWNEVEEVGWLAPARRADGTPDDARPQAISGVVGRPVGGGD